MLVRNTWKTFKDSGFLWWINRILRTFGWVIVMVEAEDGSISDCYPARTDYRGFTSETENDGYTKVTDWLSNNICDLREDIHGR